MLCEWTIFDGQCGRPALWLWSPPERPGGLLLCGRHASYLNERAGQWLAPLGKGEE